MLKSAFFASRFLKEDYLQQNAFTKYDKYCPFYKSVGMLENIVTFHKSATAAIEKTASGNSEGLKITYNVIRQRLGDLLSKISSQKFEDPGEKYRTFEVVLNAVNCGSMATEQ